MTAQIIDISGKILDDEIKRDILIICKDVEDVHQRMAEWTQVKEALEILLGSSLRACGLTHFETERMSIEVGETNIAIEYQVDA